MKAAAPEDIPHSGKPEAPQTGLSHAKAKPKKTQFRVSPFFKKSLMEILKQEGGMNCR